MIKYTIVSFHFCVFYYYFLYFIIYSVLLTLCICTFFWIKYKLKSTQCLTHRGKTIKYVIHIVNCLMVKVLSVFLSPYRGLLTAALCWLFLCLTGPFFHDFLLVDCEWAWKQNWEIRPNIMIKYQNESTMYVILLSLPI